MDMVTEEVSYPAALKAIGDGLLQEAHDIKSKAPLADYLTHGAPLALALVQGWSALGDAVKTPEGVAYLGLLLGKITAVFVSPSV